MKLSCYMQGKNDVLHISISPTETIYDLKEQIYQEASLAGLGPQDLTLTKVDADFEDVEPIISAGQYRPNPSDRSLYATETISDVWSEQPPNGRLHVFVSLPGGIGSPTLVYDGGEPRDVPVDRLQEYKDIFVKVNKWGEFERSDIKRNRIQKLHVAMLIPNFVTTFEQKLARKPRLHPDTALQLSEIPRNYFKPPGDSTAEDESHEETTITELPEDLMAEDESHEETRYAELLEVTHTAFYLALYDWKCFWQPKGAYRNPLTRHVVNSMFFDPLILAAKNKVAAAERETCLPITVILECGGKELRQYCPCSDFHISISVLPRLLVEVHSTSEESWPVDLIRVLTTGAFIVRFANKFVSAFRQEKNFALCAIYIWDNGFASCFTLFQQQQIWDNEAVYYNTKSLSLNDPVGRVDFARHLYNLLCVELDQDQDQDTKNAIHELLSRIKERGMVSMHTKDMASNTGSNRTRTGDGDRTGGGDGYDRAQLRAHGYEVKSEVFVDASGGEWEPLFKRPDHILTVYRALGSNEEFIAKKVREESNELEILRLLDAIPLKSDHVISLIDSFYGWAILPKMVTVKYYVEYARGVFESKVSQVCLGLIEGLAYLHEHCIAHRDIKPDNLLVDDNFCLKVIDFDIAMQVQDEDEEVDDQCGTENWMAPEVEELRHSPIKADRWACGRVLLFLLDQFRKEDKSLRTFARDLMAHNPTQRPSLLEWRGYRLDRSRTLEKY